MEKGDGDSIRFIDLFGGVGGFRLGIERATGGRWKCVWYCDIDKYAVKVYNKRFNENHAPRDIREVDEKDIPPHDLICGGFPCQAFSVAGKRKGFEDTRGTLFFEICRIASHHRPRYLFLENVKGLLSHDKGKTIEKICESLSALGYIVNYEVYNSKHHGVPQNRERVFLLCERITHLASDCSRGETGPLGKTVRDYLFQKLLENSKEVMRMQGKETKESVLAMLVLKEIGESLGKKLVFSPKTGNYLLGNHKGFFPEKQLAGSATNLDNWESHKGAGNNGGVSLIADGSGGIDPEKAWGEIERIIASAWEERHLDGEKYSPGEAMRAISRWSEFPYEDMLLATLTFTVLLRRSSRGLWSRMLSDLTVIKRGTNYARIVSRTEEEIVEEGDTAHPCKGMDIPEDSFIVPDTGGRGGREVLPVGKGDGKAFQDRQGDAGQEDTAWALRGRDYKDGTNFIEEKKRGRGEGEDIAWGIRATDYKDSTNLVAEGKPRGKGKTPLVRSRSNRPWKKGRTAPALRRSDKGEIRIAEDTEKALLAPCNFKHKAGDGTSTRERILTRTHPALQSQPGHTQATYVIDGYNKTVRGEDEAKALRTNEGCHTSGNLVTGDTDEKAGVNRIGGCGTARKGST